MYGWRARIGSIAATPSDIFPYEFYRIAPEGLSIMPTALSIPAVKEKDLNEGRAIIEAAAMGLAREGADVIVLGAAPMLYSLGPGSDRVLSEQIQEATGVPTVSNQTAMMDGLKAFGAEKILIASPFVQETNAKLKVFLEGSGFRVVGMAGYGKVKNADINQITRQQTYRFVRSAFRENQGRDLQAILMPCANWPTSLLVDKWETELGIPVVTSNLAKLWAAFRIIGIKDRISGYGSLLATKL